MQEQEGQAPRRAHDDLVRRLDQLSKADAERVLERAFRMQSERHDTNTVSREQLDRIAAELGVDRALVDRALREEMKDPGTQSSARWAWLGPRRLTDRTEVLGAEAEVAEHVIRWMEDEEGFRPVSRTGDGMRWMPDTRWTTSARLAIRSDASRTLRGMSEVTHRQISLGPERQVVEVDVDTGKIRTAAAIVVASVTGASAVGGIVAATLMPGGNDLAQFLLAFGPGSAVGVGSAAVTAVVWTHQIREGLKRALAGIGHPELYRPQRGRRGKNGRRSGFRGLVDEVSNVIEEIFD